MKKQIIKLSDNAVNRIKEIMSEAENCANAVENNKRGKSLYIMN